MLTRSSLALALLCASAPPCARAQSFDGTREPSAAEPPAAAFAAAPQPAKAPRKPLAQLAEEMEALTQERHSPWFGLMVTRTYSKTDHQPKGYAALADAAIWTGVYVAAEAKRYEVTGDKRALANLERSVAGLVALHDVTGIPGLIARVIVPTEFARASQFGPEKDWHEGSGRFAGWTYRTELTNDQYDGYLFGLAAAWPRLADPALRADVRRVASAIADHVIAHDMRIHGSNTFLDFRPYYMYQPDWPAALRGVPLPPIRSGNAAHGLHLMKVCAYITGEQKYEDYYVEKMLGENEADVAIRKYGPAYSDRMIRKNRKLLDAVVKLHYGSDTRATAESLHAPVASNLSHMAYYDLARLETDEDLRKLYRDALAQANAEVAPHANSFWNLLYSSQVPDERAARAAVDTLRRLPDTPRYGVRRNSEDASIPKYRSVQGNFFKAETEKQTRWMTDSPLPVEKRVLGTAFAWQHNPYTLDGGDDNEGSGAAFLIAY